MHLFDIDVKGGIRFKESETLSAGNDLAFIGGCSACLQHAGLAVRVQ